MRSVQINFFLLLAFGIFVRSESKESDPILHESEYNYGFDAYGESSSPPTEAPMEPPYNPPESLPKPVYKEPLPSPPPMMETTTESVYQTTALPDAYVPVSTLAPIKQPVTTTSTPKTCCLACCTVICCAPICCLPEATPPAKTEMTKINWKALGRILLNPLIMPMRIASQAAMNGAAIPASGGIKGAVVSSALVSPIFVKANGAGPLSNAVLGATYGLPYFISNRLGKIHPYFKFD